MAIGYGDILAQGILGAVSGGAKAVASNAEDEIKAKLLKDREQFLSDLRTKERVSAEERVEKRKKQEEADVADFYSRTGPKTKTSTYTDTLGDETEGASAGGIINETRESEREVATRRAEEARKTGKKGLIESTVAESARMRELDERREERGEARRDRYEDREEAREDRRAARGEAAADRKAAREEARERDERHLREAAARDWKVDADGYYRRPDGSRVMERVRVEGRGFEEVPIKAPSKGKTRAEETFKENLDSINRIIEQARKDMNDPMKKREAEKNLPQLLAERDRLMGKPDAGEAGPVKPKSQAEFDALPKGARYVNPRDGRIYIKK